MCRLFWLLFAMCMKSTRQDSSWPMGQKYSDVHVHAPWRFVPSWQLLYPWLVVIDNIAMLHVHIHVHVCVCANVPVNICKEQL